MADHVQLDWVEFTIVGLTASDQVERALSLVRHVFGDFDQEEGGFSPYPLSGRFYGTGRLGWHLQKPELGVHISFPSTALGSYFAHEAEKGHQYDGVDFLAKVLVFDTPSHQKLKFTRLDVAFDDLASAKLDFQLITECCASRSRVVSPASKIWSPGYDLIKGEMLTTIYVGSLRSKTLIRFYDKALQENLENVHWLRCEVQTRHERADDLARRLVQRNSVKIAADYVKKYIDFKVPVEGDINKRRWPSCSWWLEFLETSKEMTLALPKNPRTVERSALWFQNQTSRTMAMLDKALARYQIDWADILSEFGQKKLTKEDDHAIRRFSLLADEVYQNDVRQAMNILIKNLFPDVTDTQRWNYINRKHSVGDIF